MMRFKTRLVALVMLTLAPLWCCAEDFGIGAPEFDPTQSILDSQDLMPILVRKGVGASLIRGPLRQGAEGSGRASNQYSQISDALHVTPDYARWSFRIKSNARFSDRSQVSSEDVVFSLTRCAERGAIRPFLSINSREQPEGISWIEIDFGKQDAKAAKTVLEEISNCPILQRKSSIIFGKDLGVGSNIVSGGPYVISAVVPGRKYILSRVRQSTIDRAGLDQIELRGFDNAEQGLAALRVGTIRAFAVRDEAVILKANRDETLEALSCRGYVLLKRRGVVIQCYEELSILDVRGDS